MGTPKRRPWSLSTTVRNPERLVGFLKVLQQFEGRPFDKQTQVDYQIALIQERLYRPQHMSQSLQEAFEKYDTPLDWQMAKAIFEEQNYKDPPMRGRQSLNPLKKFGFVQVGKQDNRIIITESGRRLLQDESALKELFFRAFLKLQFPNPLSQEFRSGFNIRPFIAVLRLLWELRSQGQRGLSREEFCLFVPTLINADDIGKYLNVLNTYRQKQGKERKKFVMNWIREFYEDASISEESTQYKNLFDYGDNAVRAFRLTGYLLVRVEPLSVQWTVELEPTRITQIELLLDKFSPEAMHFSTAQEYIDYLSDPQQPPLPWEEQEKLYKVVKELVNLCSETIKSNPSLSREISPDDLVIPESDTSIEILKEREARLRSLIRKLNSLVLKTELRHNWQHLKNLKDILSKITKLKNIKPEELEKLVFDIFAVLNDEIHLTPNYPTDDIGNPLSHAPGNRADIEVVYPNFHLLIEVTLDRRRLQWVRETQPVMRHLSDYQSRFPNAKVFCLFLAPSIHRDTYSQFWFAVRHEYDGLPRRIVPLTLGQFVSLLDVIAEAQITSTASHLESLFEKLTSELEAVNGFKEWSHAISDRLLKWCKEVKNAN